MTDPDIIAALTERARIVAQDWVDADAALTLAQMSVKSCADNFNRAQDAYYHLVGAIEQLGGKLPELCEIAKTLTPGEGKG